jgi:hypothetical protein
MLRGQRQVAVLEPGYAVVAYVRDGRFTAVAAPYNRLGQPTAMSTKRE